MIKSEAPIIERMTLFWSNHFVTEAPKIRSAKMMYEQNKLLRKHALGSFKDLLKAISIDPAMLIYLDGWKNTKKNPNPIWIKNIRLLRNDNKDFICIFKNSKIRKPFIFSYFDENLSG